MFELVVPVLTHCKVLIPDSGGPGKFRGGLGQRAVLENLGDTPMSVYLASERTRTPCFGVLGGHDGRLGHVHKNGEPHFPKGKISLAKGDRLTLETPGGGGWGNPAERPRDLVAEDLRLGLISADAAADIYNYAEGNTA